MKTVKELCAPRQSIFRDDARDDVLDITNLLDGSIDADKFFSENFQTQGMKMLLRHAFDRFAGKSDTGLVKLTQAMGGGKTHNMLALALLARDPALRTKVLGPDRERDRIGAVKVIAFTGRESDHPLGVWGALAEQLGRKDLFRDLYSPLKAPGQSAWVNLLKGETVLVLLDELPPYLDNARAVAVGNSDLCAVTVTALSNLFNALGQPALSRVCVVFSDLAAAYRDASESLRNLAREAGRMAIDIAPVASNTDEVYDILRTRLFEKVPAKAAEDVREVASAWRDAAADAVRAGYVNATRDNAAYPDAVYAGVVDSYPFHPGIKDLYARFKENQNFQQTRGLIRLMRRIVRQFWEGGKAGRATLLAVNDFDLNDPPLLAFLHEVNPSLENAVAHDIAASGRAVAEVLDKEGGSKSAGISSSLARLLYVSSLNDTPNGVRGLSEREAMGYLAAPGADLAAVRKAFEDLRDRCWYLKSDAQGRYLFQNTRNLVAEVNAQVASYDDDVAFNEIAKTLEETFRPTLGTCYGKLAVFPDLSAIVPERDKPLLVVAKPCPAGLNPDLAALFENAAQKNRLLFLTGPATTMDKLLDLAKRQLALERVMAAMRENHTPASDSQYLEADAHLSRTALQLLQTIRDTFVSLYYPAWDRTRKVAELARADFSLILENNRFEGEKQVIGTLTSVKKFEDFTSDPQQLEVLRVKCERRLFTQPALRWGDILDRAAASTEWQLLHPNQMEAVKKAALDADRWREEGGYLRKGPFPLDPTGVQVEQTAWDGEKGEFTLSVRPVNGDTVLWEVGADPSSASAAVQGQTLKTKATQLRFLCEDRSGKPAHPTGAVVSFQCRVPLRHELRKTASGLVLELLSHPSFDIRYTTDGSNPKENGGLYTGTIPVPAECRLILAAVFDRGVLVEDTKQIVIDPAQVEEGLKVDPAKPLRFDYNFIEFAAADTAATYAMLDELDKFQGSAVHGVRLNLSDKADSRAYLGLDASGVDLSPAQVRDLLDHARDGALAGRDLAIRFTFQGVSFATGADFLRFVDDRKLDLADLAHEGIVTQ